MGRPLSRTEVLHLSRRSLYGAILAVVAVGSLRAAAPTVDCRPAPEFSPAGQTLLANRLGKDQVFRFPAFSQKVEVNIALPEPQWIGKVTLLSSLPPEQNIDRIDIAISEDGRQFSEVEQISGLGLGTGTTQISAPIKKKAKFVRVALRPPFIEVPMSVHSIGLEHFPEPPKEWSEPASEKISGGSVVFSSASSGSFFYRDLQLPEPGAAQEVRCDLRIEDGGQNTEWNMLLQSGQNTACRVGIKQFDDKLFAVIYDGTKPIRLCEVPTGKDIELVLRLDPDRKTCTFAVDGVSYDKAGAGWPLKGARLDRILFSVPKGGGIHRLDNISVQGGAPQVFGFEDINDFNSWTASGQTEWSSPKLDFSTMDAGQSLTLSNADVEVKLDKRSGELLHVTDRRTGVRLADAIISDTMVQTLSGDRVVEGVQDKVVRLEKTGENSVSFEGEFAGLPGVLVRKKYTLDGALLARKVTYTPPKDAAPDRRDFITPTERIYLPKDRVESLIFAGGDPWYSPRLFAKDIKVKSRQRGAGNSHGVVVIDGAKKSPSLSLVRYKVNDRFVWPLTSAYHHEGYNVMNYFPDGIQVPMTTLSLNGPDPVGYESILNVFEGDELDFAKNYRTLPLVEAEYAKLTRPKWLKDVICQIWLRPDVQYDAVAYLKQLLEMTDEGDIMVVLNQPFIWGDFGEGPRFQNIWGGWIEDAEYTKLVADLKALSPRVNVTLYTWIWTVAPESDIHRKHPEYFLNTDRSGKIFKAWPGLEMSRLRKMSHPEGFKALADQYRRFVEKYDIDFIYLDGGMGGANLIDWKTGEIDQEYHWQDFYEYMRQLAAEKNGGGLCFNNKNNPIADSGISEMALDAFQTDAKYVISRIWGGKIQEAFDPEHRIIPCYWGYSDPWYTNVCLGLGMLPHIEYAGLSRIEPNFIVKKAPLLAAIHEMSRSKPVGILPGTLLDKSGSDVIGFDLERGGTRILPLILNADRPEKRTFALPEQGWKSDQPLFVWQNHLTDPDQIRLLTEKQEDAAYADSGWLLSDVITSEFSGTHQPGDSLEFSLRPKLVTLVALSQSRGVLLAVDGSPTQSRFADTLGIHVETRDQAEGIQVTVRAPEKYSTFDVAIALPEGRSVAGIENAEFRGAFVSGKTSFLVLRSSAGELLVRLAPRNATAPVKVEIPSKAEAGKLFSYRIDGTGMPAWTAFNFLRDGRLVAAVPVTGPSGQLPVPEYALNGGYDLELVQAGSVLPLWSGRLTIRGGQVAPLPKDPAINPTPPSRTVAVNHPNIKAIGLGGGQKEKADPETMRLVVGNPERPISFRGYSCAGFEFANARTLNLKITSDLATRYHIENQFRKNAFAGLIVDYKIKGKFVKRVALGLGVNGYESPMPSYGAFGQAAEVVEVANWIREETSGGLVLNLEKWAPPGWQGECFVSAMITNLLPGRTMTVDIEPGN
jgi:hypothetical protein